MKFQKMPAFNLTIFVEISLFWENFFIFRVLISLITSLELVSLKVKFVSKLLLFIFVILSDLQNIWALLWVDHLCYQAYSLKYSELQAQQLFSRKNIKNLAQFIVIWNCFIPLRQIYFLAFWEFFRKEWNNSFPKRLVVSN